MTIVLLLVLAAFVVTIGAAMGRAPIWVAVFLLVVVHLLGLFPIK